MSGSEPNIEIDEVHASLFGHEVPNTHEVKAPSIEDQLAHIIGSAREVAITAEELLRDFSAQDLSGTANKRPAPHAIVLAPRLLSATQQQLESLLAMMRTI